MAFKALKRAFHTSSEAHQGSSKFAFAKSAVVFATLAVSVSLGACGVVRMIAFNRNPQRFSSFQERNFLASAAPSELIRPPEPDFASDTADMAACFQNSKVLANHLQEFAKLSSEINAHLQASGLLPSKAEPFPNNDTLAELRRNAAAANKTPIALANALTTAVPSDSESLFTLVMGPSVQSEQLSNFDVLQDKSGASVFAANSPALPPESARTAECYLAQSNTTPGQTSAIFSNAQFKTRSIYGRSLASGNTYQVLLQCAQVSLKLQGQQESQSMVWPRVLVVQTGNIIAEQGVLDLQSTRSVYLRPSLVAAASGAQNKLDWGPLPLFQTVIREQHQGSNNATIQLLRISQGSFKNDGAATGLFMNYEREAGATFFSRFTSASKSSTQALHSFASFQPGVNKISFEHASKRTEQGLDYGLSQDQTNWYAAHPVGKTLASTQEQPPKSAWTTSSGFRPLNSQCLNVTGLDEPDYDEGGLHFVDSSQISKYSSDVSTGNIPAAPFSNEQLLAACTSAFNAPQ